MGRKDARKSKSRRSKVGLYLLAATLLAVGAVALGVFVFGLGSFGQEASPVKTASKPDVSSAPDPAKKQAAKPALVKVPKIPEGATRQEAEKLLKSNDLKLGKVEEKSSENVDKGGVITQKPSSDAKIKKGSAVGITLSSGPKQAAQPQQAAQPTPAAQPSQPDQAQQSSTAGVANVPAPSSSAMSLTVPKMGISGQAVGEGVDEGTLYNGPGHAPTSGYPWISGSNTYIAGHVLGYSGTGSYMNFAALPNMTYGDQIYITDANGTQYTYTVSDILQVSIYDTWVINPTGKDQVSLQTCINPPAYDVRLVVRGDLTSVGPA